MIRSYGPRRRARRVVGPYAGRTMQGEGLPRPKASLVKVGGGVS